MKPIDNCQVGDFLANAETRALDASTWAGMVLIVGGAALPSLIKPRPGT